MASERLFLLDGMALAYRAYFTFISRPLINSKGENTSAIYGFVTALMKILQEERPEYVAVAFDTREPTFRHRMYSAYKATRQKMPEGMAGQMDKLKEVVRAFNTPLLELPGYEADDIIGTIARRAEKDGIATFMVTGDKDFMQLISPLIKMYKPGKSGGDPEVIGEEEVAAKFGVTPDRVIDVLGLTGDTSDNVPGVPGIGEKTAIPLIRQYGSIPELYNNIDSIPQKGIREKLLTHRELAFTSRALVTIQTDVPIAVEIRQLRASRERRDELRRLFRELEFRTLVDRLNIAVPDQAVEQEATTVPDETSNIRTDQHAHKVITGESEFETLVAKLGASTEFVVNTLIASQDPLRAEIAGLAFCLKPHESYFIPFHPVPRSITPPPGTSESLHPLDPDKVLKTLKPILENPRVEKIGHNIKRDILVLKQHGIDLHPVGFDTMVASYVLRPDASQGLDALAMEHLKYKTIPQDDIVGTGRNRKDRVDIPPTDLASSSAESADVTMRIFESQKVRLHELNLWDLCKSLEIPLISVLARMEFAGINLDTSHLAGMSKDMDRQIDNLMVEIHAFAGERFNINSTQQLADILFQKLGLRTVRKTKTGFSTDAGVLESLRGDHPIIEKLLEYRLLTKLKSTYVDALPQLVNPKTGRLHTSFNQTVAATGRLASSDPNLQNIPIRSEMGREIRRAFIPGAGQTLLMSADYSQIELRVMAHVCSDPGLSEAFINKEDIHVSTASKVFGVKPADVIPEMRRKAKEVNFGIMYGLGPFGLSTRLEISQGEAKEIIANYFLRFPKVKEYIHDTIAAAKQNGYVSTLLGRRRYLPEINSRNQNIRANAERQAINMPIQGTAADMIKRAMITIDQEIADRSLGTRMLLQVHDELLFEVPTQEVDEAKTLVASLMKTALPLSVPIEVDVGVGKNWLEAH